VHQIHATESKIALKACRAKNWAEEKYMKLQPATRGMITGTIAVASIVTNIALG
jgi:hypothetical protein